ncbi:vomeronasal type-2 receptor 26-like [Pelodytes ibericus]
MVNRRVLQKEENGKEEDSTLLRFEPDAKSQAANLIFITVVKITGRATGKKVLPSCPPEEALYHPELMVCFVTFLQIQQREEFPLHLENLNSTICSLEIPLSECYYQDGDLVIGGLITVRTAEGRSKDDFTKQPFEGRFDAHSHGSIANTASMVPNMKLPKPVVLRLPNPMNYQNVMAFVFAISEINRNLEILPNVTLGFHIVDPCLEENLAVKGMSEMISTISLLKPIPNYRCGISPNLVGFVDSASSAMSLLLARVFGIYRIPQISYGSMDPVLSDKVQFPYFYRTVPSDTAQYRAIVKLVKYFGWSWVGILVSDDESGLRASQMIQAELKKHGYCVAFLEFIQLHSVFDYDVTGSIITSLRSTSANVVIVYGERNYIRTLQILLYMYPISEKVWIISSQWDVSAGTGFEVLSLQPFNGSLAFTLHSRTSPGFEEFSLRVNPASYPKDIFINQTWMELYDCNYWKNSGYFELCAGNETIQRADSSNINKYMSGYSYSIYNAVYALAHALHHMSSLEDEEQNIKDVQAWEIHEYLRNIHFTSTSGEDFYFNENGDINVAFDMLNWVISPDETRDSIQVGQFLHGSSQDLVMNEKMIRWNPSFVETPRSVCSESCNPGYRKSHRESQPSCCYDCIPCPEGEISNQTDMGTCIKCPEHLWPNINQDTCIHKLITYLSYEDSLGKSITVMSIVLFLVTCLVMIILVKHRNTPVVKANNRDLSFILLASLKMCFLCSLIFIGHPHKVTCILRQPVFGVTFSIAVSSILAKTVTVIIAFNATKPGSKLRKWMGSRTSNSILLSCSSTQVVICVVWLGSSPPFPHYNMTDEIDVIVAECQEGSQIGFYCVLGYMGLLATLSFIIAFLARNLPDVFNEATFITFSMLVFCSVWISFIPAYMSSKGKYVVAVEIFTILASSTGLLGCIFIPKCYIILLRPEMNSRNFVTKTINVK